jgi:hypothetical protein
MSLIRSCPYYTARESEYVEVLLPDIICEHCIYTLQDVTKRCFEILCSNEGNFTCIDCKSNRCSLHIYPNIKTPPKRCFTCAEKRLRGPAKYKEKLDLLWRKKQLFVYLDNTTKNAYFSTLRHAELPLIDYVDGLKIGEAPNNTMKIIDHFIDKDNFKIDGSKISVITYDQYYDTMRILEEKDVIAVVFQTVVLEELMNAVFRFNMAIMKKYLDTKYETMMKNEHIIYL